MSLLRIVQLVVLLFVSAFVVAIDPITVNGRHFVNSKTGEKFWIKGIDYQPGGAGSVGVNRRDPLSDPETCARDVFLMQQLGVNTVRIYSIDPTLNHDVCMSYLAASGIYLILDVNSPIVGQHLNRYEPWTTYTEAYLYPPLYIIVDVTRQHVFAVIEAFKGYHNLLALFAGNEVVNDEPSASVSPRYVKAVVRDIKNYIAAHVARPIPIGYSAADDLKYRVELPAYLTCGDVHIDFYGVNTYQWCGTQTFRSSAYDILTADYSNYSQPIFFSEFGCNLVLPRKFQEVTAIFSDQMTGVFSGGLAFEFTQEPNNYGLVQVDGNSATILNDFITLQTQYNAITTVPEGSAPPTTRISTCPPAETYANLNGDNDLPDSPAADLIKKGISSSLYSPGKLIMPSVWATKLSVIDQDGNEVKDKMIKFNGYKPSNPANGGAGRSGTQIGGGRGSSDKDGSSGGTSGSRRNKIDFILLPYLALGIAAVTSLR